MRNWRAWESFLWLNVQPKTHRTDGRQYTQRFRHQHPRRGDWWCDIPDQRVPDRCHFHRFTGAILVVTAFLPFYPLVTNSLSITSDFCHFPLLIRRDKNGTKPKNKISKNTFEPIKSLRHIALRLQSFCKRAQWKLVFKLPSAAKTYAKVLFCPVKNECFAINLLFCGVFADLCGTKDNTNP